MNPEAFLSRQRSHLKAGLIILLLGLAMPASAMAQDAIQNDGQVTTAPQLTITPDQITPEMQAAAMDARQHCEADLRNFCQWVMPGGGRIANCLIEHFDTLSSPCQTKIAELLAQ